MENLSEVIQTPKRSKAIQAIESVLKAWEIAEKEVPSVHLSILGIARRAGMSVQEAWKQCHGLINVGSTEFCIKKEQAENIRMKALIRRAVINPPIRGLRDPGRTLDERRLERLKKLAKKERARVTFQPFDEHLRYSRRDIIKDKLARRWISRVTSSSTDRQEIPGSLQVEKREEVNFGKIITRTDIHSTLGPFEFAPNYEVKLPQIVVEALGRLVESNARVFSQLVTANTEGDEKAYQHCRIMPDGNVAEPFFQVDLAGLSEAFLTGACSSSIEEVTDALRVKIFEFEPSIAMYELIQKFGGGGSLGMMFRDSLNMLREKHDMLIALLAPTCAKLEAIRETEFGKVGNQSLPSEEVREISGFDALFGPDDFKQHLKQHQGQCQYLLYVRPSDPIIKLKDPSQKVANPLLNSLRFRKVIRRNAITLNIDDSNWPIGDPRSIKDSKVALPLMNMAFPVQSIDDIIVSTSSGSGTVVNDRFAEYMHSCGLMEGSFFRAKPMQGVFGGYGQRTISILNPNDINWLRDMLVQRGPYVIQPEIEPLVVIDSSTGRSFAVMDRAFFSLVKGTPEFIGGIRILIPMDSVEAQKGRLHGTSEMVSAPITGKYINCIT